MSRYGYIAHSELQHHGIKGMHWGIRRYQNPDGSLTEEGKRKYYTHDTAKRIRAAQIGMSVGGMALSLGNLGTTIAVEKVGYDRNFENAMNKKDGKSQQKKDDIYKNTAYALTALSSALGTAMVIGSKMRGDRKISEIIKNASPEEFNKIRSDKRFRNNVDVINRIHFDDFEKKNHIKKTLSDKEKCEAYVKSVFNDKKIKGNPVEQEYAWSKTAPAAIYYGVNKKEMESLCYKYDPNYKNKKKH